MVNLGELLDEQTKQRLQSVVLADLDKSQPAKTEPAPYVVLKASTEPNRPRTLTAADAIDIDPRGEAMFDAQCVDCKVPMLIEPQLPEGADPEALRVPICVKCAKVRARFAAMDERRNVEVIRRPMVTRRQPRTTDGIDHPVTVTNKKEPDMFDVDNMTDAELGAAMRQQVKAVLSKEIEAARPAVEAERVEHEAEQVAAIKDEQEDRVGNILPGFMVGTHEVPALDLSDVTNLDETMNATMRSPYNKARYRLKVEGGSLDPETTTYKVLAEQHEMLRAMTTAAHEAAAPKGKKAKAEKVKAEPTTVILAVNEPDEEAKKVKALAKVLGVSKKEARAIMLANA